MSRSGVTVDEECIKAFSDLKLYKKYRYIVFKMSDDLKEIVLECTADKGDSKEDDWQKFREHLVNAKTKTSSGEEKPLPRYAVYDMEYSLASGEGERSKIVFLAWSPDGAPIKPRMVYASSKDALKRALDGVAVELQANDSEDIEHEVVLKHVSKGLAV